MKIIPVNIWIIKITHIYKVSIAEFLDIFVKFLCPPNPKGVGHIVFGADPVSGIGVSVGVSIFPCIIFLTV